MNTDLMNVNAFENQLPDTAFASLNPEDENLADGIGQSYPIVGYKGKVWTLRYRGETHTFTRPDDGSPAAFLDVIILRSAGYRSKSWYEGGYAEGVTGTRPSCASLDGIAPDADVQKRQAPACSLCPRNEFKQLANGRKGKDCSDYKRLAVLILPSQSARLFQGQPLMEPAFLRVPAASLNDLAVLGGAMGKKGFHYATYITRIGFDAEKPHPQMTFRALQKLTSQEAPIVIKMREEPQTYRITGENEVGKPKPSAISGNNGGQAVSPSTAPANTTGATQTTTAQSAPPKQTTTSPSSAPSQPVDTGFGAGVTVMPPTEKPAVNTGFGIGLGDSQPVVEVVPSVIGLAPSTMNTEADTGPAEESDADLDARVAGLLQR